MLSGFVLAGAAAAFTGAATTTYVDKAEAYSVAAFCQSVQIAAGGRCVDYRRVRHRYVQADIIWALGTGEYCVGAKQNADGTGANTKGFGCSWPHVSLYTYSSAQPSPGSPLGYATIINQTGYSQPFWGDEHWYP
jgi:hypothetical protein